jgi:hypothetical protein
LKHTNTRQYSAAGGGLEQISSQAFREYNL